jgi:hypothetical protein
VTGPPGRHTSIVAGTTSAAEIFGPIHGASSSVRGPGRSSRGPAGRPGDLVVWPAAPPFATLFFELWAARTGRLAAPADRAPREHPPVG